MEQHLDRCYPIRAPSSSKQAYRPPSCDRAHENVRGHDPPWVFPRERGHGRAPSILPFLYAHGRGRAPSILPFPYARDHGRDPSILPFPYARDHGRDPSIPRDHARYH